jgi:hypothetical protein
VLNPLIPIAMLSTALGPGGSEPTAPRNDSICQRDMKADLFFLAGDRFRGRLTATPENDLASEFIAARFERLGLKRVGTGGSYFHRFHLVTASLGPSNELKPSAGSRFHSGQEFVPLDFSPPGEHRNGGPLVFAGFGICDPERGHDDYRGIDVKGRIVLVLEHEPGENDPRSPFDGVVTSEAATPWRKAMTAQEKGAVGILFVTDVHNHPEPENFEARARAAWPEKPPRIPHYLLQDWVERIQIPAAQVSTAMARTLLRMAKGSFEDLARAAEKSMGNSVVTGSEFVELATDVRHHVVPDRNVLAALEGSDPQLKDEWVVISCHHDHNGADGDQVFNGADDNGSGVVGLRATCSVTGRGVSSLSGTGRELIRIGAGAFGTLRNAFASVGLRHIKSPPRYNAWPLRRAAGVLTEMMDYSTADTRCKSAGCPQSISPATGGYFPGSS